jgi:hypothetical protein
VNPSVAVKIFEAGRSAGADFVEIFEEETRGSALGLRDRKIETATAGTDYAAASHSHGNITKTGNISGTAPTIVSGDRVVILDASKPGIANGPTFDGSTTTKALTPKGTWETFLTLATLPIYDGTVV